TITDQELLLLKQWAKESSYNADLLRKVDKEETVLEDVLGWLKLKDREEDGEWSKRLEARTLYKIAKDGQSQSSNANAIVFRKLMLYAAAILVISAFTFIIYRTNVSDNGHIEIQDLTPGTNRALITLSDGSVIELSEVQEGVILGDEMTYEDGTLIRELDEGKIVH